MAYRGSHASKKRADVQKRDYVAPEREAITADSWQVPSSRDLEIQLQSLLLSAVRFPWILPVNLLPLI